MKWNENGSLIKVCLLQSQVCLCFWVLGSYYVEFWVRWSLLFFYNFEFFVLSFFYFSYIFSFPVCVHSVSFCLHGFFFIISLFFWKLIFFLSLFTFTFWALHYKISLQYSGHCSVINQAKWQDEAGHQLINKAQHFSKLATSIFTWKGWHCQRLTSHNYE